MNVSRDDMKYLLAASILAASNTIAGLGFFPAWYIGIGYLSIVTVVYILATGILFNPSLFDYKDAANMAASRGNTTLQLLVHVVSAVYTYNLYSVGFVFISGAFSVMLAMSVWTNLVVIVSNIRNKPK